MTSHESPPVEHDASTPPAAGKAAPPLGRVVVLVAVTLGFVIALMSSSIKNTVTAYYVTMTDDFGVSRGTFAIAPSVFALTYAVASPVLGFLADRIGSRRSLASGLMLAGVLFLAGGAVESFALFSLLYGVGLAVAYTAVSYVPLGVLVDELFPPHRRGLTYAILMNGTAVGFIALVPLWIQLEQSGTSWRVVFVSLGVAMLVLTPLALVLIPGQRATKAAGTPAPSERAAVPDGQAGALGAVLRSRVFWLISLAFFGCGVTMGLIDVHLVASMQSHGMGGGTTSVTMVLLGAAEIVGALLAGYLCDKGQGLRVLAGSYLLRAVALVILALFPHAFAMWVFGLLFGLSYLGTVVAGSLYLLNAIDSRSKGLALGLMWFVHQLGAFAASQGGGLSFDAFHSYNPMILVAAATAGLSVLIVVLGLPQALRDAERKREQRQDRPDDAREPHHV